MKFCLGLIVVYQLFNDILCYNNYGSYHYKYTPSKGDTLTGRYIIECSTNTSELLKTVSNNKDVTVHRIFSHELFQGFSIEINNAYREKEILNLFLDHENVVSVWDNDIVKSKSVTISSTLDFSPETIKRLLPHHLHQVDKVRDRLNLTGEGIFVGVIDTGVEYRLPALGGGFGPGFKVIDGFNYIYDKSQNATRIYEKDPLDYCPDKPLEDSHGTHVAGIIAGYDADNNFEGVAPNAKLGVWRVLGCDGTGSAENIVEAMLAAQKAGVHILNLSLGDSIYWTEPNSLYERVTKRIAENGIIVVFSAGNEGGNGAFTSKGLDTDYAFSVASSVNEYTYSAAVFEAEGIPEPIHFRPFVSANETHTRFIDGELIMLQNKDGSLIDFCVENSTLPDLSGKIIYLPDIKCSSKQLLDSIRENGAAGLIFYHSEINSLNPIEKHSLELLPTAIITFDDSRQLYNAYKKNHQSLLIKFRAIKHNVMYNDKANTISSFSSVGPTVDLEFSPDIAAAGENIISTVSLELGYGIMDGTSMAAPYISGALALYLEYHGVGKTNIQVIRSKFKNYASITTLGTGLDVESPLRQGAGLVQVYDAIIQTNYVMPPHLTFKDSADIDAKIQSLTITNGGHTRVTYNIYNNVSIAISPYNRVQVSTIDAEPFRNIIAKAIIEFSQNQVELEPGESKTIQVKVLPPRTNPLDRTMYGGFIQFSPVMDPKHKTIHVPYFGLVGIQKNTPIIDSFSFEYIGNHGNTSYNAFNATDLKIHHAYNPKLANPFIKVNYRFLEYPFLFKTEVLSYPSYKVVGTLINITKPLDPTVYSNIPTLFDGHYCSAEEIRSIDTNYVVMTTSNDCKSYVRSGSFVIRVSALKIFGEPDIDGDWQTWTTLPFKVMSLK